MIALSICPTCTPNNSQQPVSNKPCKAWPSMDNIFNKIYDLLKAGEEETALTLLIDNKTGRVKKPYHNDLNHAWYVVGDILAKTERYQDAINAFKKSFKHQSSDIEAIWAIATCYSDLGKPSLSKFYLLKAIKIDKGKNKDELTYDLGNALFDLKKYDEAIKAYRKVSKKNMEIYSLATANIKHATKEKQQIPG